MASRLMARRILLLALTLLTVQVTDVRALDKNSVPATGTTILADMDYFPALLEKINSAKSSIDLAMFVFKTSKSPQNRPSIIINTLKAAAKRGVAIRVFLEKSNHDEKLNETNQKTAQRLKNNGIKVVFDSPGITTHAKIVVIDRRYSLVGSHNFTHSALKHNHELSLLIDSPQLALELTRYMEKIER